MGYKEERPSTNISQFEYILNNLIENYDVSELDKNQLRVLHHVERYMFVSKIIKNFKWGKKPKIIDIGCGEGIGLHYLLKELGDDYFESIDGVDITKDVETVLKKLIPNINFYDVNINDFDYSNFDIILCMEVLGANSLDSSRALLLKLKTMLADEGLMFISIPNYVNCKSHEYFKEVFNINTFKGLMNEILPEYDLKFYGQMYPTKSKKILDFGTLIKDDYNFMICEVKK